MIDYIPHSIKNAEDSPIIFLGTGCFCLEISLKVDGNEVRGYGRLNGNRFDSLVEAVCQALNISVEVLSHEAKDGNMKVEVIVEGEKSEGCAKSVDEWEAFAFALIRAINVARPQIARTNF